MYNDSYKESKYLLFFDECGDHSLQKIDDDFPLFVLSAILVERTVYTELIVPRVAKLKLSYWDHEGVNLHSRDIRKARSKFSFLLDSTRREEFLVDLHALMISLPMLVFISGIRKREYLSKNSGVNRNPYNIAIDFTFERVLHFLETQNETHLPVIAEARGANEDKDLEAAFYRLMSQGTATHSGERFKEIECPISFEKKYNNIVGLQLADLCAHPAARHILKPKQQNTAFEVVKSKIYDDGKVSGWKVYP